MTDPASTPEQDSYLSCAGPVFYWNLTAAEQARLRAENVVLEDEGYLAHDINWGRRLVALSEDYTAVPDVDPDWLCPPLLVFSDAVSAILQAAVEEGLDATQVLDTALHTQEVVRESSAASIRRHR